MGDERFPAVVSGLFRTIISPSQWPICCTINREPRVRRGVGHKKGTPGMFNKLSTAALAIAAGMFLLPTASQAAGHGGGHSGGGHFGGGGHSGGGGFSGGHFSGGGGHVVSPGRSFG